MSKDQPDDFQERIEWLLTIVGILLIIVLVFIYPPLTDKKNFLDSLRQLAQNIVPGIVGAIISYFTLYFFLFKKNISTIVQPSQKTENYKNLREQINKLITEIEGKENNIDQLKEEIKREEQEEKKHFKEVTEKIEETKNKIVEEIDKTKKFVSEDTIEINQLYTLYGLKKQERKGVETFQDFNVDYNSANVNAVSFLWADTLRGNEINASIIKSESELPFLRIKFDSKKDSYGCNLAIRPQNEQPLDNRLPNQKNYFLFDARIPEENETEKDENLKKIVLAFRVINGYMQHWEYANHPREYIQIPVEGNIWQTFALSLNDLDKWSLFDSDGNTIKGPKEPNFDVISSIILKVGRDTKKGEPGDGKGIIDIRRIKLSLDSPKN